MTTGPPYRRPGAVNARTTPGQPRMGPTSQTPQPPTDHPGAVLHTGRHVDDQVVRGRPVHGGRTRPIRSPALPPDPPSRNRVVTQAPTNATPAIGRNTAANAVGWEPSAVEVAVSATLPPPSAANAAPPAARSTMLERPSEI